MSKTHKNPITGETFTILERNGANFQFDYTLKPGGIVPVAHIHPRQDEIFEIQQGELTVLINGGEQCVKAGETYTIPAGVAHQPKNAGNETLKARVSFSPAHPDNGDAIFFESYCGFATDGKATPDGSPPFLALAVLLDTYSDFNYIAGPPIPVQKVLLKVAAIIGRLKGYQAYYPEYSG